MSGIRFSWELSMSIIVTPERVPVVRIPTFEEPQEGHPPFDRRQLRPRFIVLVLIRGTFPSLPPQGTTASPTRAYLTAASANGPSSRATWGAIWAMVDLMPPNWLCSGCTVTGYASAQRLSEREPGSMHSVVEFSPEDRPVDHPRSTGTSDDMGSRPLGNSTASRSGAQTLCDFGNKPLDRCHGDFPAAPMRKDSPARQNLEGCRGHSGRRREAYAPAMAIRAGASRYLRPPPPWARPLSERLANPESFRFGVDRVPEAGLDAIAVNDKFSSFLHSPSPTVRPTTLNLPK